VGFGETSDDDETFCALSLSLSLSLSLWCVRRNDEEIATRSFFPFLFLLLSLLSSARVLLSGDRSDEY
jgi:hypothetical protein